MLDSATCQNVREGVWHYVKKERKERALPRGQYPSKQRIWDPYGPQMGNYMGPIWATHVGPMWVLQQGFIWDPSGHIHMAPYRISHINRQGGGEALWLGRRISDQGVPGSNPGRCTFRCGLEQVTFTLLSTG